MNIKDWKLYSFSEIFIVKKGFYNKKPEQSGYGNIPFIGATDKHNGVTAYYTYKEIENASKTGTEPNQSIEKKIFPPHAVCVTNNGSVGYAYYQDKEFTCSHDVNPLYIKNGQFNEYSALFVATVIMQDRYRWGYGRKWRPERMINSHIMLPANTEGEPDWEFMTNYVRQLHCSIPETHNQKPIDIFKSNWQRFSIASLLAREGSQIYKSKPHSKVDLECQKQYDSTCLPFISRTEENNSVDGWVKFYGDPSEIEEGNALVIGDTTATIAYQEIPFITGDHIIVIRAPWLNKYTGLFIKAVLEKERYRYSYGRAFKMNLVQETEIPLPVDDAGKADWMAMENYVKSLPEGDLI